MVIAFLVTGLIAPGFLLGGDNNTDPLAAPPETSSSSRPTGGTSSSPAGSKGDQAAKTTIKRFLDASNSSSGTRVEQLICGKYRKSFAPYIKKVDAGAVRLRLLDTSQSKDGNPKAKLTGRMDDRAVQASVLLYEGQVSEYCVAGMHVEYKK